MRTFFVFVFFITLIFYNGSQPYPNQIAYTKSLQRAENCEFFTFEARVDENKRLFYNVRKTSDPYLLTFPEDKNEINKCLYEKSVSNKRCEAVKFSTGFYPKSFDTLTAYLIFLEFSRINEIENSDFRLMPVERLNFHAIDTNKAQDIYNRGLASKNAQFLKETWSAPLCHSNKGLLYQYGIGVVKNLLLAEKLYLDGIDYNSRYAYKNLALLYEENLIFGKSKNEINLLYLAAAERGDLYSRLVLRAQKK
jgi:TPR repeat protein